MAAKKKPAAAKGSDVVVGGGKPPKDSVYIGQSVNPEYILLRLANRHGLITGATGTGKTVTLQGLAEGFSDQGVPVFCADVKGDLSGVAEEGEMKPWIEARDKAIGFTQDFQSYPVIFWDLFGKQGHPIRATVASLGALLLSRLMDLSEAQEGVLNIAFKIADDEKLQLINLKDLQDLLQIWPTVQAISPPDTGTSPKLRSARSSAPCSCSNSRVPSISSVSPRSRSPI